MNDDLQSYMPLQPGEIIAGKYRVVEPIGAGGMSFVVSATHVDLGEKVAIKLLRPELMENEEIIGRFTREAKAAVRIKSEHVAHIIDVGNLLDGLPFIVMEYLDGKDLFEVLLQEGCLSVDLAIEYILQTCEALASAHNCGIVHRDIKPENLFLIKRAKDLGVIKVIDFGISKVALTGSAFDKSSLIHTTISIGTPVYMSPEQIRALSTIDHRTDIWSLGCVLYELITGKAAFDAPSIMQLSALILEKDPKYDQKIPLDLYTTVIMRCLAKDPKDRFQNIAELAMALYPFATSKTRVLIERCCNILNVNNRFSTISPKLSLKEKIKGSWFLIATVFLIIFASGTFYVINKAPSKPQEIRMGISIEVPVPEIKQQEILKEEPIIIIDPPKTETPTPITSPSTIIPTSKQKLQKTKQKQTIPDKEASQQKLTTQPNKDYDVGF